jgi:phage tail sheath protein FI
MYLHPGVYIEEIPSGSRPIEAASTSTALIAGYATKGPIGTPTLLFSFDQYMAQFGGIMDFNNPASGFPAVDYMGHTVRAFFDNGGSKAYIARLVDGTTDVPVAASTKLVVPLGSTPTPPNIKYLHIQAVNPGEWANDLQFQAKPNGATPARYTVSIGWLDRQNNLVASEVFTDVSFDPDDTVDFVGTQVNGVSTLIKIDPLSLSDVPDTEKTPLMIGSLTSDLLGLTAAEIAALDGKKIKVKVDPGVANDEVTFATPVTLDDVASQIQAQVRLAAGVADPKVDPRVNFTCKVENSRLVLRSGALDTVALGAVAAVTVSAGTPDGAATLKLITGATKQTGQQAFDQAIIATLSNTLPAALAGGTDGGLPGQGDYDSIMPQLKKLRDISIILLPGQTWLQSDAAGQAVIGSFVNHAETMKNRMVIVDPAPTSNFTSSLSFLSEGFPTSTYTATYYPWLEVANPYYHAELRPDRARTVFVPPSGFAAGLFARTDGRRGVWKAPAGVQATLNGAANTRVKIGDDEQDQFNPVGLNCFRRIISDIVIWGSRTLATKSDPEWRYVPVRRTAMMLEESIYQGIQWAVFEPNDHRLWSSLRLNIGGFMDTLFRAGAFQGEKASDAYFVRCGLGDTMTQAEIDAGQVIVVVGFAPLKPAEFVIVRIQQIVGKQ